MADLADIATKHQRAAVVPESAATTVSVELPPASARAASGAGASAQPTFQPVT